MQRALVIAPHPDDETFGCGGSLLKHVAEGTEIHWLIMTSMTEETGFSKKQIETREVEIKEVEKLYGFTSTHRLKFRTTSLDVIPLKDIVKKVAAVFKEVSPSLLYLPSREDAHSDHQVTFDAAMACTKWFRYPSIRKILAYETLSETGFRCNQNMMGFHPNVFIGIEKYLEKKIEIVQCYPSELGDFPFPRSIEAIRTLAAFRGTMAGFKAAEAFVLLKEIL